MFYSSLNLVNLVMLYNPPVGVSTYVINRVGAVYTSNTEFWILGYVLGTTMTFLGGANGNRQYTLSCVLNGPGKAVNDTLIMPKAGTPDILDSILYYDYSDTGVATEVCYSRTQTKVMRCPRRIPAGSPVSLLYSGYSGGDQVLAAHLTLHTTDIYPFVNHLIP